MNSQPEHVFAAVPHRPFRIPYGTVSSLRRKLNKHTYLLSLMSVSVAVVCRPLICSSPALAGLVSSQPWGLRCRAHLETRSIHTNKLVTSVFNTLISAISQQLNSLVIEQYLSKQMVKVSNKSNERRVPRDDLDAIWPQVLARSYLEVHASMYVNMNIYIYI